MVPQPLDYATSTRGQSRARRVSKIAVTSLALAILGCPCLINLVEWHDMLVTQFALYGSPRYRVVSFIMHGPSVVAMVVAVIAIVSTSATGMRGRGMAVIAFGLGAFWLLLLFVAELMWSGFRLD